MKKTISLLLSVIILLSTFSICVSSAETKTVEKERYYFLMPDGTNGQKGDETDTELFGEYAQCWYNEYTTAAGIYWWNGSQSCAEWPGYKASKADSEDVYYYNVPSDVPAIIWNNYVNGGTDYESIEYQSSNQTYVLYLNGDLYDYNEYPEGTRPYKNMIFVVDPDPYPWDAITEGKPPHFGRWYYYYGQGCYGTVEDGDIRNCIREDHDHENLYINFDPTNTGWDDYEKVYCVIEKLGGSPFYTPQTTRTLCTDYDGDGIYTYDLNKSEIKLKDYSVYYVFFMTDTGERTRELTMQTTNIKGTAYATGELSDTYAGSKLKWENQYDIAIPAFNDIIREYEEENNVKVETYRNYFYIPDGSEKFKDADGLILPNWFNEYYNDICITYMKDYSGGFPYPYPKYPLGFSIEKTAINNIYYADIPVNITQYLIGNGVVEYSAPTYSRCESYILGPDVNNYYSEGLTNCDNMIFVFNEMDWYSCTTTAMCGGDWYYYYGDGCYGTVKDGSSYDCIRDDHFDKNGNHLTSNLVIGDVDGDSELSIMDATEIQMVIAKLKPSFDDNIKAITDVDNDGELSILDATAIQLKLAKIS